jgi:hypothetical protein
VDISSEFEIYVSGSSFFNLIDRDMMHSPDNFVGIILSLFSNCVQYIDLRDHFYFFNLPILIFIRHIGPYNTIFNCYAMTFLSWFQVS